MLSLLKQSSAKRARLLRATLTIAAVALSILAARPQAARAGGFELPIEGPRALGRGGASAARGDDPLALRYDPAGLTLQNGVNLSLAVTPLLAEACFDRRGNYAEPSASAIAMPEVCSNGINNILPEAALSWRILPELGVGLAFLTPYGVGHRSFGDANGSVEYDGSLRWTGVASGRIPAPTRYDLIDENIVMGYPTVGVSLRPHPMIQLGASFGAGFASIDSRRMTRLTGGEDFASDIATRLQVLDAFIPRLGFSVHGVPHDNLDVTAFIVWQDAIRATGDATLQAGTYSASAEEITVSGTTLTIRQPLRAGFAIRYAARTAPRSDGPLFAGAPEGAVGDPLSEERWDLELDVIYERNRDIADDALHIPTASGCGGPCLLDGSSLGDLDYQLARGYKDQVSVRLGGDYVLVPGMVALRAGGSFETNGVTTGEARVDFSPRMRLGGHVGATLRLEGFDLTVGYAFLADFDLWVSDADADVQQLSADGAGTTVNRGTYRSSTHAIGLGALYHF